MIWISGIFFAIFHSVTASDRCKQWTYALGLKEPNYRLIYSVLAMLTTAVWAWYIHQLPDSPLYQMSGLMWWGLVLLQIIGLVTALAAFLPIDGLVFLGLRKAKHGTDPFVISGIYKYIRHPMYAGVMLMLLAMPEQSWNGLNFSLVLCAYFIIGSRFEESRMLAEHPEYGSYKQRVASFIPCFRG
ncbi:MAG: NnrU family protein [Mariprofundaceae bacterium]|nr:NnrU family protein [Mariprofundaceae bacterium]